MPDRALTAFLLTLPIGFWLYWNYGVAAWNPVLALIRQHQPGTYQTIWWVWTLSLFSTPYFALSLLMSTGWSFALRLPRFRKRSGPLPELVPPEKRDELEVVIGELHHQKRQEPSETPSWLTIPARGLYTGIMGLGAVGTGKTSSLMYPSARQILGWKPKDQRQKAAGLVLEVKGSFCFLIQDILREYGRGDDWVEVSLRDDSFRYNPLHTDRSAGEQAFAIATLMNQLNGKGKDPFWQSQYKHMITNLILLYRMLRDYVTFHDLYDGATDAQRLQEDILALTQRMAAHSVLISGDDLLRYPALDKLGAWVSQPDGKWKAVLTEELEQALKAGAIPYNLLDVADAFAASPVNQVMYDAVQKWHRYEWTQMEHKLKTSIIAGISEFLAVFRQNPAAAWVFCPPKGAYTDNADGKYGRVLPTPAKLIEEGKVLGLNFPVAESPSLSRLIGVLLKQDWQRAMLLRIPEIARTRSYKTWRPVLFLCDEYHMFATCGASDPAGDEQFFGLSREAKCIPVVATQSLSSLKSVTHGEEWTTLVQQFRTKVLLTTSDKMTAEWASAMCGREDRLVESYSMSESGSDGTVSMMTGKAVGGRSSLSVSKSYSTQVDVVFQSKVFTELKNSMAVVLGYDGVNPLPATLCYLRPHWWTDNESWWTHMRKGTL